MQDDVTIDQMKYIIPVTQEGSESPQRPVCLKLLSYLLSRPIGLGAVRNVRPSGLMAEASGVFETRPN
jgi:hypothetical protein